MRIQSSFEFFEALKKLIPNLPSQEVTEISINLKVGALPAMTVNQYLLSPEDRYVIENDCLTTVDRYFKVVEIDYLERNQLIINEIAN